MESLVPAHCEEGSVDHFFENGEEPERADAAASGSGPRDGAGAPLRGALWMPTAKARVGVEAVREEHPLAALLPCDNVFAIESRWYRDNSVGDPRAWRWRDAPPGRSSRILTIWRAAVILEKGRGRTIFIKCAKTAF